MIVTIILNHSKKGSIIDSLEEKSVRFCVSICPCMPVCVHSAPPLPPVSPQRDLLIEGFRGPSGLVADIRAGSKKPFNLFQTCRSWTVLLAAVIGVFLPFSGDCCNLRACCRGDVTPAPNDAAAKWTNSC